LLHSDFSLFWSELRLTSFKVKVKVTLRLTVSQSVTLGVEPHLGLMTRYLLLFDSYGLIFVGRLLWREDAAGPCQRSLPRVWVPWDSRPYFTVSDLRLSFLSPPTTRRVTVEVFDSTSTRVTAFFLIWTASYIAYRYPRKCLLTTRIHENVFVTRPLAMGLHVTIRSIFESETFGWTESSISFSWRQERLKKHIRVYREAEGYMLVQYRISNVL
jgi:hypothetical protein